MAIIARQSTTRTVTVGPVLDATGVAVTDGVVADFKIAKNGGAPAALNGSATLTHRHTGFYSLALTASDLDTVGQAEVTIDDTVNSCGMKEITVVEEAIYDALFVASANGFAGAAGSSTVAFSNTSIATVATVTTVTNQLTAAQIATGVWTDTTAGDFTTALSVGKSVMNGVTLGTGLTVAAVSGAVGSVTGAVASVTGNVGGNVTGSVGSVTAGVTVTTNSDKTGYSLTVAPPTAAQVATAVWQDTTAGDFTVASSVGKSLYNAFTSNTSVLTTAALANAPTGGSAPTTADIATAVWTDLLAGSDFSTVASVGKLLKDDIDATISSRSAAGDAMTLTSGERNSTADAVLGRDWTSVSGEASYSVLNALRLLRNVWDVTGSTLTVNEEDGTTVAWTRSVSTTAGAAPVTRVS